MRVDCQIQITELEWIHQDRKILGPISCELHEKRVAIVGRNGSGKSTFSRLIAGLVAPTSGTLRVNDADVYRDRKAALNTIGFIFQNPDHQIIFPTVAEEIAFGLRQKGIAADECKASIQNILNRFNRADWIDHNTQRLSQGQRHLLCLMAVLVMEPNLIILDEPFAGLDIPTTVQLRRVFDGLEQSIIHVTHDLDLIKEYDRVIWLDKGLVVADGLPSDVIPTYQNAMATLGAESC